MFYTAHGAYSGSGSSCRNLERVVLVSESTVCIPACPPQKRNHSARTQPAFCLHLSSLASGEIAAVKLYTDLHPHSLSDMAAVSQSSAVLSRKRTISEAESDVTDRKGPQDKRSRSCPYLDTINRSVLDFDFEKLCSVSLSHLNVYACLVCGKYFQGQYF